ncbi:MAG: tRNA (N6-threonylcarbamoyladenosine(37)-N6)-methyltransferase TrmO [Ignisphaera sp.]
MTVGWLAEYTIILKPIGIIRHGYPDEFVSKSEKGVDAVIEILPDYVDGLKGLDEYSHIIVVAYLHKVREDQRKVLLVKQRGFARRFGAPLDNLPTVGVFASNSPHRPNPIAISIPRLIRIDGNKIFVEGIDLYNDTPVIDIKPYTPDKHVDNFSIPKWMKDIIDQKTHMQS